MKNKEKYASEIVEIACNGDSIAITSDGGKLVQCNHISCCECVFENNKFVYKERCCNLFCRRYTPYFEWKIK